MDIFINLNRTQKQRFYFNHVFLPSPMQLWRCIMNSVEWNKKEELVAEQAMKYLKVRLQVYIVGIQFVCV